MRRVITHVGLGLVLLAAPAMAEPPAGDPDHARAQALERLRAQLTVERNEAQEAGRRIAAAPITHHARAAPAE